MTRYAEHDKVSVNAFHFDSQEDGAARWSAKKFGSTWLTARVTGQLLSFDTVNKVWLVAIEEEGKVETHKFKPKWLRLVSRCVRQVPELPQSKKRPAGESPSSSSSSESESSDDSDDSDPAADVQTAEASTSGAARAQGVLEVPGAGAGPVARRRQVKARRPVPTPKTTLGRPRNKGPVVNSSVPGRVESETDSSDDDEETLAARAARVEVATKQQPSVDLFFEGPGGGRKTPIHWKAGGQSVDNYTGRKYGPKLTLPDGASWDNLPSIFGCFFPMHLAELFAKLITENGRRLFDDYKGWHVSPGEVITMLGVFVYFGCYPEESRDAYWNTHVPEDQVGVNHDFAAKYGVSLRRFQRFMQCFCLPEYPDTQDTDTFVKIRRFADLCNANIKQHFECSWIATVDESMAKWVGQGMPGWMFVARKPRPMGRETHTICCGESKILFFCEIYEGKECMATKEYNAEYGKSTGLVLRMTASIHSSGRVVIADAGETYF
jgi:hypothetical protein